MGQKHAVNKTERSCNMQAIGIDLGTTNSCVAARVEEIIEVLENDAGNLVTPSCVAFTKGQTLIGESAKRLVTQNPEETIYSIKRIMGRKFDDLKTQQHIERWPFKVERSTSGRPMINIKNLGETYNPEEISGLVLDYMRRIACGKLSEDVRDAVVTVPAYFNHMQRTATKTAAELAGLNVLGMINEPTAAAFAFGLIKKYSENRNILVYDFGGGTFDATVLSIKESEFDVKASTGNTFLGGDDLTNRMVKYFVEHVKTETRKDITGNKRAMAKLLEECERAKKELSFTFKYELYIENIVEGVTLEKSINRSKFQSLNRDLLTKTMDYVRDVIEESGFEKKDIHFVVPVGGSSRIPIVVEKLENYFGKNVVKIDKTPEHAVAKGAAIYAAYLSGESVEGISEVILSEVTPLSLGTDVSSGENSVIIKRNTKIPVIRSKPYHNASDYQISAGIGVCQGEEKWFKDNQQLGGFNLSITPKLKGEAKIDVEYRLNRDGILQVKATDQGMGKSKSTVIDLCSTLEKLDIERLKLKLWKLKEEEKNYKALHEARYELESLLNDIRDRDEQHPGVIKRCDEVLQWLERDPSVTIPAIQQKKIDIENKMRAIDPNFSLNV